MLPLAPLLRRAHTGARVLHRNLGPWPFILLALWALATRLQEPAIFQRQAVPLFWSGASAILLLLLALIPLSWRLTRGETAHSWERPQAGVLRQVFATWLGQVFYGLLLIGVGGLLFLSIDRIFGSELRMGAAAATALRALLFLLVITSLGPGLATLAGGTGTITALWCALVAAVLVLLPGIASFPLGPLENRSWRVATDPLSGILGGLALSVAQVLSRHR
jgi:hypothetical protein